MKIKLSKLVVQQAFNALGGFFALTLGAQQAHAATYSAVNDFSLASNPNGVWSYGTLSTVTGGTFTKFTLSGANNDFTGEQFWFNGGSVPNSAAIVKNASSSTQTYQTIVQPTNELRLDGENSIADLRFVTPATAVYSVAGLFQRIDNKPSPVTVSIIENGTITLFSSANFTTFNSQQTFNFAALSLPAGTTLDFVESAAQFNNDSTGVAVTISSVPEPATITLALVGLAGVVFRRRRTA